MPTGRADLVAVPTGGGRFSGLADWPQELTADSFRNSAIRGVNGYGSWGPELDDENLAKLTEWGVNAARAWLRVSWNGSAYTYDSAALNRLNNYIARLARRRIYTIPVVSVVSADMPWTTQRADAFVALWRVLSTAWRRNLAIAGYDLLNEPATIEAPALGTGWSGLQVEQVGADWERLALRVTDAIRAIEPRRVIVYEVGLGAFPDFWTPARQPLPRQNIVYSPHSYRPHELTHDQVDQYTAGQPVNPTRTFGAAELATLDASVAQALTTWQPALPKLVGEFSCARWAPQNSAALYVGRSLELFEAAGASWLYHEFRGDPVWDPEAPNGTSLSYARSNNAPVASQLRAALALPPGQYAAPEPGVVPPPAPPAPPPPVGTVITSLSVVEEAGQAGSFPITAAVRLQPGAVPAGSTLESPDDSTLRAAVLSTHPDGSAMLAVVGGTATLAANAVGSIRLQAGAPVAGAVLTAARIAELAPSASVAFTGGVTATVALNTADAPTRTWWASQQHVCASWVVPVPGVSGLCVVWVVHAWAGAARMLVECTVENSLVNMASPADFTPATYSAVVTIGGAAQPAVSTASAPETGHQGTRAWYASGWIGGSQSVRATMLPAYLQTLPELWRVDQASSSDMATYAADAYTAWGNGRLAASNMGGGGDVPGIGPLPQWESRTLQTGDRRGWRATEVSALSALSYNINTRAADTRLVPTFADIGTRRQGAGWPRFIPSGGTGDGNGIRGWELAHGPGVGMMAFYGRPSPVFVELAQKLAVWAGTMFGTATAPLEYQAGVFGAYAQTRGRAWGMRYLGHAALLTPAGMPWRDACANAIERNVAIIEAYRDAPANSLGYVWYLRPDRWGDFREGVSGFQHPLWMHHFLVGVLHRTERSVGHLLGAAASRFSAVADWASRQAVRFVRESQGGEWRFVPYLDAAGNVNIVSPPGPGQLPANTVVGTAEGSGIFSAGTMTMQSTWGAQRAAVYAGAPVPPVAGTWMTHPGAPVDYSAGWVADTVGAYYYVAPFTDALACAVERGVTEATVAWETVTGSITNWAAWRAGFASDPRFGAAPRNYVPTGWASGSELGSISGDVWTPGRNGSGNVTAASRSTLQTGRFYSVADTRLDALDAPVKAQMLATFGQPWTDRSAQGWQGVTDAWVGWAVDERAGRWGVWIGPGGGHQASSNNGMYRFSLLQMAWSIEDLPTPSHVLPAGYFGDTVYPPALAAWQANPTGPVYNDEIYDPAAPTDPVRSSRKPTSRHTYTSQFIRYDEGADGTLYMLCRRAWKFDLATKRWAAPVNNQGASNAETTISFENMFAFWDEVRGRAYHVGNALSGSPADRHFWWDGASQWGNDFPGGAWPIGGYPLAYTAFEKRGRTLHMLNYRHQNVPGAGGTSRPGEPYRLRRINLDTGAVTTVPIVMGASLQSDVFPGEAAQAYWDFGALTYIPRLNRYLCVLRRVSSVGDGDELAVIDGTTGVCELASTVYSGVLTPTGAVEGKLKYFEDLDIVLMQPRASRLMRVLIP